MTKAETMVELLIANRKADRHIGYLETEAVERRVSYAELHERAFRRLGGTVRVIVLDNLREGVITPDVYDPALNPLYRDVLTPTLTDPASTSARRGIASAMGPKVGVTCRTESGARAPLWGSAGSQWATRDTTATCPAAASD